MLRAVVALLVAGAGVLAPAPAHAVSGCPTGWGSQDRAILPDDVRNGGPVTGQRVGHHACYDRVVLDVDGPVTLAIAAYRQTSSGPVLEVRLRHDSMTSPVGYPPLPVPDRPTGLPTVRALGATTQGRTFTSAALRTRARLPYRVFALAGPGSSRRLVVDVAHRW